MKKLLTVCYVCLFSIALFAQPSAGNLKGVIKKGKITINKKEISKDWKVQTVTALLGSAERIRDEYNKTHTYDRYGIVIFEPMQNNTASGGVSELQIYFSEPESNNVTPKSVYTGSFKVEKISVVKDLSYEKLKSKLKEYKLTDSYMEHSYRYSKDGIYIYFQYSTDEQKLLKVSMGIDKKS